MQENRVALIRKLLDVEVGIVQLDETEYFEFGIIQRYGFGKIGVTVPTVKEM
jgi:hypothetical protein